MLKCSGPAEGLSHSRHLLDMLGLRHPLKLSWSDYTMKPLVLLRRGFKMGLCNELKDENLRSRLIFLGTSK